MTCKRDRFSVTGWIFSCILSVISFSIYKLYRNSNHDWNMKLNMTCIKFHQKIKKNLKNLNFGLWGFWRFFKSLFFKPKNLGFFKAIFQPWFLGHVSWVYVQHDTCNKRWWCVRLYMTLQHHQLALHLQRQLKMMMTWMRQWGSTMLVRKLMSSHNHCMLLLMIDTMMRME